MHEYGRSNLSLILDKRIRELGFESLRKFYMARRETIGVSYELFRQVLHSGRIPRAESLLPILRAAQLPERRYPEADVARRVGLLSDEEASGSSSVRARSSFGTPAFQSASDKPVARELQLETRAWMR